MRFVFLGLSITSARAGSHTAIYRGLLRALATRGHDVLFLERDLPMHARHRDLPAPLSCRTELYRGIDELRRASPARCRRPTWWWWDRPCPTARRWASG